MTPFAGIGVAAATALVLGTAAPHAGATAQLLYFDTLGASATVAPTLNAGDTVFIDTLVRSGPGPLLQSATFTVGAGVTGLAGQVAWTVSGAAGTGPRLVGVNVDLIDVATNVVVASDTFNGLLAGFANSSISTPVNGIPPGTYRLQVSGNGVRDASLNLALSLTADPPFAPAPSSGALPAQGPSTNASTAFFSQLTDSRTMSSVFGAGDTLMVETFVQEPATGPLQQSVTFTLDAGVDSFTAAALWALSTAAGPGPRLIGVNIDLFDSNNALLMSDDFAGTLPGFAHSTFGGALGPGTYHLVATGTATREASLDIALTFGGTDVVGQVAEPAGAALLLAGLAAAGACRRRRPARAA